MIKTVIFDFDGTIADTLEKGFELINLLAKKYKYFPLDPEQVERYRGQTFMDNVRETKAKKFFYPFIAREYRKKLKEIVPECNIYKGMDEFLNLLKNMKNMNLGILSSNSEKNINSFLEKNHLETLFSFVKSETNILGKDRAIKKILKKFGLKVSECIYVGDEVRDIEACKSLGMKIVSVAWGYNNYNFLKKYEPNYIVKTVGELSELFLKIND